MFSAIGGLKNHQLMMDVTANNIANVNTIGYKAQRATFASMLSQTVRGASAPSGTLGGTNPLQVGLGVGLGGIQNVLTQGSLQTTGQWSDMAIQGDGYFIVSNTKPDLSATATTPPGPTGPSFTRAGNFTVDVDGDLVTQSGMYVMGNPWDPTLQAHDSTGALKVDSSGNPVMGDYNPSKLGAITIPTTAQSVSVGADGSVTYVDANGQQQNAGRVAVAKLPNPAGMIRQGDNLWTTSPNSGAYDVTAGKSLPDANTFSSAWPPAAAPAGYVDVGAPGSGGRGVIESGTIEMSNVDLAQEFTSLITAQRGFQANSKVITTSDEMLQDLVNLKH
jgi:flagellar hook protein FlgE